MKECKLKQTQPIIFVLPNQQSIVCVIVFKIMHNFGQGKAKQKLSLIAEEILNIYNSFGKKSDYMHFERIEQFTKYLFFKVNLWF